MSDRKERAITVRLSDSDCKTLMNKCGENGITINELLHSFCRVTPVLDHHNGGGCPSFCYGNVRRRYGSLLR